jgi:hypothetical protein
VTLKLFASSTRWLLIGNMAYMISNRTNTILDERRPL